MSDGKALLTVRGWNPAPSLQAAAKEVKDLVRMQAPVLEWPTAYTSFLKGNGSAGVW
jgi:hypothetical protein